MKNAVSTALGLFLLNLAGMAQSARSTPGTKRPTPHPDRRYSTLLARSEMQQPSPIPIINPLRYPEIPVAQSVPAVASSIATKIRPSDVADTPESTSTPLFMQADAPPVK